MCIKGPCPVTWETQQPRQLLEVAMNWNLLTIVNKLVLTISLIFYKKLRLKMLKYQENIKQAGAELGQAQP